MKLFSIAFTRQFFICFLIFQYSFVNSQNIEFKPWNPATKSYGASTVFPANGVADDFGPRRSGSHNWHGGIDYNSAQDDGNNDKWDMILAPEDGTIVNVNRLLTSTYSYKQLCYEAGGHRYIFGHVYDGTSTSYSAINDSTITLKNMLSPNTNRWAQILIVGGDTLIYGQVIGNVLFKGDTLTTTTTVTAGNPLVPLGDSSAAGAAHLHLNTIPTAQNYSDGSPTRTPWKSNPLEFIDYAKAGYEMKLYCEEDTNKIKLLYPGTIVSPVANRIKMQTSVSGIGNKRYSHIFDVDKVKFYFKIGCSGFQIIEGPSKKGEIILGGVLNDLLSANEKLLNVEGPIQDLVHKVVDSVKSNLQLDWTKKENAKAAIRLALKRELKGIVPFSELDKLLKEVLEQAEGQYKEWPLVG